MPNELCLRCGGELTEFSFCLICNDTIQWHCDSCGWKSEQRIHLACWSKRPPKDNAGSNICTMIIPEPAIGEIKQLCKVLSKRKKECVSLSYVVNLLLRFGLDGTEHIDVKDREFIEEYFLGKEHILNQFTSLALISTTFLDDEQSLFPR